MYQSCHLDTLMAYPYVAYEEEIIQFLSTLQVELYQGMTSDELDCGGLGFLRFSVYGHEYRLSIKRLEGLFGIPSGTGTKPKYNKEELKDLWITIGSSVPLNSSRSKGSPIIRYFQHSIANVLYSREIT